MGQGPLHPSPSTGHKQPPAGSFILSHRKTYSFVTQATIKQKMNPCKARHPTLGVGVPTADNRYSCPTQSPPKAIFSNVIRGLSGFCPPIPLVSAVKSRVSHPAEPGYVLPKIIVYSIPVDLKSYIFYHKVWSKNGRMEGQYPGNYSLVLPPRGRR